MHVAMAAEPMIVSSASGYRQPSYEMDDGELLERFRANADRQAAGLLFDRHAPLVRRLLARTLGPFRETEDHVQEAFFTFFQRIGTLRDDAAWRPFLVGITIRIARHELRRRRVRRVLHLSDPAELPEIGTSPPDHEAREALRRLFGILDELDTTSRLAFTLRFFEDMELMEVAVAIGESLSSVKRRLARVVPLVQTRAARDAALAPYVSEARHG